MLRCCDSQGKKRQKKYQEVRPLSYSVIYLLYRETSFTKFTSCHCLLRGSVLATSGVAKDVPALVCFGVTPEQQKTMISADEVILLYCV